MSTDPSFFQLTARYPDERSAIEYFTARRWPRGVTCVRCHSQNVYDCKARRRLPLHKCRDCGRQFSVTSGTVMQGTHLPLRQWLYAYHIIGASKKGISSHQLARMMGVTVKTAWHLTHRIRATMNNTTHLGGGIVESDETYIGGRRRGRGRGYRGNKIAVQVIVQRKDSGKSSTSSGTTPRAAAPAAPFRSECTNECPGQARSIALQPTADKVDGRTVGANLRKHTKPQNTRLMTDESQIYASVGKSFKSHETVNHSVKEYARTDPDSGRLISTNAAEGMIANMKRQITGTHHSVTKKHLPRYLEEYDYKYNTREQSDTERTEAAIGNIEGKRVTLFKPTSGAGDSLIDTPQGEKRQHKTKRGTSKHVRTGKKQTAEPIEVVEAEAGSADEAEPMPTMPLGMPGGWRGGQGGQGGQSAGL